MNNQKTKPNIYEFLGWHLGDGCISVNNRYSEFTLTGDIKEELQFYEMIIVPTFNRMFKDIMKKKVELKKYQSNGVCGIYIFDKYFVDYLQKEWGLVKGKKLNIGIPALIKTIEQKRSFIRGLFDTDGSIYFCKSNVKTKKESLRGLFHYKPKIKIATISQKLIKDTYGILSSLDIACRIQKPIRQRKQDHTMHSIIIDTKGGTNRFIQDIGFRNVKHITKIKIWKRFGFCPPLTSIKDRIMILENKLNPLEFYDYGNQYSHKKLRDYLDW